MQECILSTSEYNGKYVALEGEENNNVVGAGATPAEAWNMAVKNGHSSPVLLFVEESESVFIY